MHGRKIGEVMGKWAASGEGSWKEEKTTRLLVGERKEKKRKRKKRKMGCCIGIWFGPQKWRWEVGHDGLELVLG